MNHIPSLFALSFNPILNLANVAYRNCGVAGRCIDRFGTIYFPIFLSLAVLAISIVTIVGMWKIFKKAGHPGWACIVPIYNYIIFLRIINRPWWWVILFFIPIVSVVIDVITSYGLAKSFGKGSGFTVGLVLVPFIFFPILGFGDAVYHLPHKHSSK